MCPVVRDSLVHQCIMITAPHPPPNRSSTLFQPPCRPNKKLPHHHLRLAHQRPSAQLSPCSPGTTGGTCACTPTLPCSQDVVSIASSRPPYRKSAGPRLKGLPRSLRRNISTLLLFLSFLSAGVV